MSAAEKIQSYLFASGLDGLADHKPVIEKTIHDFIAQLGTPMEVSNDLIQHGLVSDWISPNNRASLKDHILHGRQYVPGCHHETHRQRP